ncbi:MAG: type II secretion system protein [Deltaproteobacteria bacterium]|nr:type II secretion system protein [Deltaproteobacteria bacterium]
MLTCLRIDRECCENSTEEGFTLVELLLAIFIFSIVISTVYGSYRATFHVVNGTEKKMVTAAKALVVLDRIVDDLSSLVQGKEGYLIGKQRDVSGMRGDNLTFVSSVHIGLVKEDNLAGPTTIEYSTEADEVTGLINLYRSDSSLMPGIAETVDEVRKYLLCDGLKEVRFVYFGNEGAESEEWQNQEGESEEGGQVFPVMVTVVLQFADTSESKEISTFTTSVALARING